MKRFIPAQSVLWMLRVLVLGWALQWVQPTPPRALLGVPQTVDTRQSLTCVHTRLTDEVEEWKIQRTLQLVRELGATTIVEFFPWSYAESSAGQYQWVHFDRIIRHAQNQGLRVLARVGMVPEWARAGVYPATANTLPESAFPYFARFVAAFLTRYRDAVQQVIIWNEPNLAFEWGYDHVDVDSYVRLLRVVYPAAHTANPDVQVLAGALAPTLEPSGSPYGLNDLIYLQRMYDAGARGVFDALAVHTYGFTDPPDALPAPDVLNFRRAELLRAVMVRNGDSAKPVYITETGWNDSPRWTKGVRPSQRIAYTLGAFDWAAQHWGGWLNSLCVWVFRYPQETYGYPDNFTMVTSDFQLKPIYYALQAYARGWNRSQDLWLPAPGSSR